MLQQVELPFDTASVPAARDFVRAALNGWHGDRHVVELLASELATNAVLHANTPFTIVVSVTSRRVRVEVTDSSAHIPPPPVPPPPDALSGRGLLLVSVLSTRWGAVAATPGKTMWFEVDSLS